MLLPDLFALLNWWDRHPPLGYSGAGGKGGPAAGEDEMLTDDALIALLGRA